VPRAAGSLAEILGTLSFTAHGAEITIEASPEQAANPASIEVFSEKQA
jgi:hypothetical protein